MNLSSVRGAIDRVLEKSLQDMVRGIRNHENSPAFIETCIQEIKDELKSDDLQIKYNAIGKITYLQMLGYDFNWASFNIIEVMNSGKFTHKRMGYLSASQIFNQNTEVLLLSTNMIKKDLNSMNMYEAGTSISSFACFVTEDMARILCNDIMSIMSSPKPYLRKRAILLVYHVFLKYPESLKNFFNRLKEKLDDPNPGVQAAAVNVICELARKSPQNYIFLAPTFFKLMTTSSNNWVLIKIIKLFGALTPLEPRIGKKLIEPLTNLIHSTSAMSLLYECINTVLAVLISISSGIPNHQASIQLCVQKLRVLIEDSDQNLKYLGLSAMKKILQHHPKSVQVHKDLIIDCLEDRDESIRFRALDLILNGMATKECFISIIKKLVGHVRNQSYGPHYKIELVNKIIQICSQSNYELVESFEWYISVLLELCQIASNKSGPLISAQLLETTIRVESVRPFSVDQMTILLENSLNLQTRNNCIFEVVPTAGWISCEYYQHVRSPVALLRNLLQTACNMPSLSYKHQAVLLLAYFKLYTKHSHFIITTKEPTLETVEEIQEITISGLDSLKQFLSSFDPEVQERAHTISQIFKVILKKVKKAKVKLTSDPKQSSVQDEIIDASQELENIDLDKSEKDDVMPEEVVGKLLKPLFINLEMMFHDNLNPVMLKAQSKVPVPQGLDLNQPINPSKKSKSNTKHRRTNPVPNWSKSDEIFNDLIKEDPKIAEIEQKNLIELREKRTQEQINNINYLKTRVKLNTPSPSKESSSIVTGDETNREKHSSLTKEEAQPQTTLKQKSVFTKPDEIILHNQSSSDQVKSRISNLYDKPKVLKDCISDEDDSPDQSDPHHKLNQVMASLKNEEMQFFELDTSKQSTINYCQDENTQIVEPKLPLSKEHMLSLFNSGFFTEDNKKRISCPLAKGCIEKALANWEDQVLDKLVDGFLDKFPQSNIVERSGHNFVLAIAKDQIVSTVLFIKLNAKTGSVSLSTKTRGPDEYVKSTLIQIVKNL